LGSKLQALNRPLPVPAGARIWELWLTCLPTASEAQTNHQQSRVSNNATHDFMHTLTDVMDCVESIWQG